jgi:phage baseplate assembly protein W
MPVQQKPTAHLLRDLALRAIHRELRPEYRPLETLGPGPGGHGRQWDFVVREGLENLAQAILLRVLTPRGELAALGHPDYGSRVQELIGAGNTESTRALLRLHLLDALAREPRIAKVKTLDITRTPGRRDSVDVRLEVLPADAATTLVIGPFTLDLGP